jgi:hypothetical protein
LHSAAFDIHYGDHFDSALRATVAVVPAPTIPGIYSDTCVQFDTSVKLTGRLFKTQHMQSFRHFLLPLSVFGVRDA